MDTQEGFPVIRKGNTTVKNKKRLSQRQPEVSAPGQCSGVVLLILPAYDVHSPRKTDRDRSAVQLFPGLDTLPALEYTE